jgi:hypothetical protein
VPGTRLPPVIDLRWRFWVMGNLVRRLFGAIATATAVLAAAGCTAATAHPAASVAPLPPDPQTASALLKIAAAFNHDYDTGDYGPVYARWDARSQAIITRADLPQAAQGLPQRPADAVADRKCQPGRPARDVAGALRDQRPVADRLLVLPPPSVGVRPGTQQPRRGQAVPDVPEPVRQGCRLRALTTRGRGNGRRRRAG